MDFSQPAKLSRNLPRHHLASQRIIWVEKEIFVQFLIPGE
jgi:hypothetical protein